MQKVQTKILINISIGVLHDMELKMKKYWLLFGCNWVNETETVQNWAWGNWYSPQRLKHLFSPQNIRTPHFPSGNPAFSSIGLTFQPKMKQLVVIKRLSPVKLLFPRKAWQKFLPQASCQEIYYSPSRVKTRSPEIVVGIYQRCVSEVRLFPARF